MICYQVVVRYAFIKEPLGSHKPALVGTRVKKQNAMAFLVLSGLPFGSALKVRRFFKTEQEAARYVAYLHAVHTNLIVPPATDGGCKQIPEFLQSKNSKLKIRKEADFKHGGQLYLF